MGNNLQSYNRDSFRKISKGGQSEDIWGGGGGGRVQWAVFNFEGLQFPKGGTKFSRGDECPPPPPPPPK